MAHAAGDTHEFPIYGAYFRVTFPILDADGDLVSGAASLDSEVSKDSGTFADCANEATEIATSSGMYYLDLTGAEMEAKKLAVIVKTSTAGAKTTPITLYPRRMYVMETGTAQAGAAGTITLASGSSADDDFYNGLYVVITNNSPAGVDICTRRRETRPGTPRERRTLAEQKQTAGNLSQETVPGGAFRGIPEGCTQWSYMHAFGERFMLRGRANGR